MKFTEEQLQFFKEKGYDWDKCMLGVFEAEAYRMSTLSVSRDIENLIQKINDIKKDYFRYIIKSRNTHPEIKGEVNNERIDAYVKKMEEKIPVLEELLIESQNIYGEFYK